MARKCDPNIYGADEQSFASSIYSDALGAPDSNDDSGSPFDQAARAKGNTNAGESGGDYDAHNVPKSAGTANDKRACPKGNVQKYCND